MLGSPNQQKSENDRRVYHIVGAQCAPQMRNASVFGLCRLYKQAVDKDTELAALNASLQMKSRTLDEIRPECFKCI